MKAEEAVWKASNVFAPTFPRQASSARNFQDRKANQTVFCESLMKAAKNGMPGYYSVYSFPRGHSKHGNIPKVDCIFIDLDINDEYDPDADNPDFEAWRRDMSKLLARSRMIAGKIIEHGSANHYRAALSGHKGLHIYLDFPTVAPENGSFKQFKTGLESYGETVMTWLDEAAGGVGIDKWVDVDASDLGRLARHPNTVHHGANYDDTTRYCVPVTIEELAEIDVDDYLDLTESPRWLEEMERDRSPTAGDKVVQAIRNAPKGGSKGTTSGSKSNSNRDVTASISKYESQSNEDIEAEDIAFLTSNYPCIASFLERDDAFDHGNASHLMEMNVIAKFVELQVPKDVIHEVFEDMPRYDRMATENMIDRVISGEYKSFNCAAIASKAPQFCHEDNCAVYRRSDDIQT
jgi:hypothetical protein